MKKILIPLLLITLLTFGKSAVYTQQNRPREIKIHNINQVEMCVSNFGKFGQTITQSSGCWWPKGSNQSYIFGAGSWFGAIIGDHDTLVTIGYGPHGAETEYVPGDLDMSISDPAAVIWMYPAKWPPTGNFKTVVPPTRSKSHQDSWCVYNDLDATAHVPGDTRPIGLVMYQTVYAWNLSTTADIIFVKFEVRNVSGADLHNCYFGVCTDNDIGNEAGAAANDRISGIVGQWYVIQGESLWVDNLGYQWQEVPEAGWVTLPGAIGFDYLQSPWDLVRDEDKDGDGILDQYERDSTWYVNNLPPEMWDVDGDGTPDWRDPSEIPQLGMTAFKRFTLSLEPNKDNERYVTLAGYNFKTGEYTPYDTVPPDPDDQRFLMCSGPFELQAESTATVLVGIMFANWMGIYQRPDTALVRVDNTCQFIYDMNWLLPGPPSPPALTCVPGDAQITLIWNSAPEFEADPYYDVVGTNPSSPLYDPYYRQYDFEGYRVYRSLTGRTGDWQALAVCDRTNGIRFEFPNPENTADTIYATDAGLYYSYRDNTVRNGFTYYYAVTSFDFNQTKLKYDSIFVFDSVWYAPDSKWIYVYDTVEVVGPMDLIFESGKIGVTAVPRRDPANYVAGSFTITQDYGNPLLADSNVGAAITYPLAMTADPFYLDFAPIGRDSASGLARYTVYMRNASDSILETYSAILAAGAQTRQEFVVRNGLSMSVVLARPSIPTTVSIFRQIERVSGTYPVDSLVAPVNMATNWAYRGNDYQLTWIDKYGSGRATSVIVVDLQTGDTIPFKPYLENAQTDSLADGWTFRASGHSRDTLVYGTPATGTRNVYINGGKFKLGVGWLDNEPRPSVGETWIVYAGSYHPAPQGARLIVTPVPARLRTDTTFALNVKVVPNPYLVYNEWQQTFSQRRIRFINLPSECTIRIFTLNGDLVRTIHHHHTLDVPAGTEPVANSAGGDEEWDLLSENRQLVASGIYVFQVQSSVGQQVGKFVVIR